ncbi:MAG TPA: hypothetical protein VN678_07380 [Acidobacteriaceae bacterium]|nr:hypothetical protein [Acidobacteriaceae bacterium]
MLDMFDSPILSFVLGGLFLVGGFMRGRRRPDGSLSANAGRYVMGAVALLLIANGIYQSMRGR